METGIGGEARLLYGMGSGHVTTLGNKALEWDPNDWKWDGDLFIANPLKSNPSRYHSRQLFPLETGIPMAGVISSNSSSSCSDEVSLGIEKGKRELEKRRRPILIEDETLEDEAGGLTLKLGGKCSPTADREATNWDATCGKKTKFAGSTSSRAVCQVDDCGADLIKAKDYHRRHKVCEMHSKASRALVGSIMQRFCQQCSRFHALQEFDEGKRSCRRRLAGHNKRRRKTQPDTVLNSSSLNDGQANANGTNDSDNQGLLSHLLSSLANHDGLHGNKNVSGLLQESQTLLNKKSSSENSRMILALSSNGSEGPQISKQQNCTVPASKMLLKETHVSDSRGEDAQTASSERLSIPYPIQDQPPAYAEARDSSAGRCKLNNFDLNDVYIDSDVEDVERSPVTLDLGNGSIECPSWLQQVSHQSSPPQTSGNSDSASAQSPSSSSGDAQLPPQCRTDRIVFKLFGKEPSDFPLVLRAQIRDWLAHSPTDMESYIRPGCITLTIYVCLPESFWEELSCELGSSLSSLLDVSGNPFWRTGWIYMRVQNQIAFINNGKVLTDMPLALESNNCCRIQCVKPIAVPVSERAQFLVKGYNLSRPSIRLLCALEGSYLAHEATHELVEGACGPDEPDEFQCRIFSCTIPPVAGRGFFEVEDQGLSNSFFPFVVAEENVCSEIRMLESVLEFTELDDVMGGCGRIKERNQALDFIYEMGWLLHRTQLKSRLAHMDPNSELFSLKRFKWLMEFSVERGWCAVVKKLLDILLGGVVGAGDHPSLMIALREMGLLHRAVRRNSRPLVELLLRYIPVKVSDELISESKSLLGGDQNLLFKPDVLGPAGLTPLHVAAGRDNTEDVLDALTEDPGQVGIEAWKGARDSTGFTPEDYARLRGHYSYIHLVQKKINRKVTKHVVLNIPIAPSECNINQKENEGTAGFQIDRTEVRSTKLPCRICVQKLAYGNLGRSLLYRPAMLSMVAIAAVCVCVALLFKSSPEVVYVFRPFRWEMLDYGSS